MPAHPELETLPFKSANDLSVHLHPTYCDNLFVCDSVHATKWTGKSITNKFTNTGKLLTSLLQNSASNCLQILDLLIFVTGWL